MSEDQTRTRRRGKALESALLDAAWEQLMVADPAGFTLEAVAERAQTSKSVLYRRWMNAEALLTATLARRGQRDALPVPDTGDLREDLLALLRAANQRPERFLLLIKVIASGMLEQTGMTPAELREKYFALSGLAADEILDRAAARGEIDAGRLTPRLRSLPFDLFRAQLFLTLAPLEDAQLLAIVDEVVMPLLTRNSAREEPA